jgi:hypothetical protein
MRCEKCGCTLYSCQCPGGAGTMTRVPTSNYVLTDEVICLRQIVEDLEQRICKLEQAILHHVERLSALDVKINGPY